MTIQESNRASYRRLQDAINTRDIDVIARTVDDVFHADAVFHAAAPTPAPASQAVKGVWATLLRAFPDIKVEVDDMISEGDKIVVRNTVTGTHQGEYRGLAPTGRTVVYDEIFIARFVEGRVAEVWGVVDVYSQMRQLGAVGT